MGGAEQKIKTNLKGDFEMKTLIFRMRTLAVLLTIALFPLMAAAEEVASVDMDTIVSAAKQVAGADMEAVIVMGVVNKDGDKLVLNADDESYVLDSQVDEAMIGQKVVATGGIVDTDGVKIFKPQSIKVAE